MRRFLIVFAALTAFASSADAQKIDAKGKCHDAKGAFAPMSVCKPVPAAKVPNCKKGKLCGNACIPKDKVCHKPS